MKKHIELTNYTCYGMGLESPEDLIVRADSLDINAIAYTDFNNVYSFPIVQKISKKHPNVKPIYGIILLVKSNEIADPNDQIFLAKDQLGLLQIYRLFEMAENGVLSENQITNSNTDHLICGMPLCWTSKLFVSFLNGAWRKQQFVLINEYSQFHAKWNDVLDLCQKGNIVICASDYADLKLTDTLPLEYRMESILEINRESELEYIHLFGIETAMQILYENPQSIADRIQNNIEPLD